MNFSNSFSHMLISLSGFLTQSSTGTGDDKLFHLYDNLGNIDKTLSSRFHNDQRDYKSD